MNNFDNKYFKVELIAEKTWSINGQANDLMYLIEGKERAMLIDTGMGIGNLSDLVKTMTKLPIIVVNTHGHPDHAGGNSNFEEVYLHPADFAIKDKMCTKEYRLNDLIAINNGDSSLIEKHILEGLVEAKEYIIHPIYNGQVFDLGGKKLEVIEIPGHTPGSICLLDAGSKFLFAGDSIVGTPIWMYLDYSYPVETLLSSLKNLKKREAEFELIFPGHLPTPIDRTYLADIINCAEDIIGGSAVGIPTKTFAGEGIIYRYGRGSIIYNEGNIRGILMLDNEKEVIIPKAQVGHINRKWIDIAYARQSTKQKLDIYLPETGQGPFPVILAIHGGAFAFGDKSDIQICPQLNGLERGYAVVAVNYRLSGEAKFPKAIHDLKAAIRWIRANSKDYLLNSEKIIAWGNSAEGNYAAMLGASATVQELEDLTMGNKEEMCNVQAVVDWYGPTDFIEMDENLKENGLGPQDHSEEDSPESRYLGTKITEVIELVKKANPVTYITSSVPPYFIQHGSKDHIVPIQQSILLVNRIQEAVADKDKIVFDILDGVDHEGPEFMTPENIDKVFIFIDKYMK